MTITEAEAYTKKLLRIHLPKDWQNWKVEFFYSSTIAGTTYPYRKVIELSLWVIQYAITENVIEIIKHEVAHAVAFVKFKCTNHNHIWVNVCKYVLMGKPELEIKVTKRI